MIYTSVTYGDIVFGTADVNGITWCLSSIVGWGETPPLNQEELNPTGRDGGIITASTLAARPLVLRGTGQGTDLVKVFEAYDRLSGFSWPLLSPRLLLVNEQGSTRQISVITAGSIRKEWAGPNAFIFEIPLIAADPLKYSFIEQTASLPGTISNVGNYPSNPVIVLTAGGTYTITNTTQGAGAILQINSAPAGAIVDMNSRKVTDSLGNDIYSSVVGVTSVWWGLQPANNVITKTGGTAAIYWRDAWI